jgi:hypothetical protein
MNFKTTLYVTLLLICALVAGAHADIKYTQTMTMGDNPDATPMIHTSHFVAPGKERNDTEMNMGNYHSKEAVITICQPEQTIHIDDALKIYAIEDGTVSASAGMPPMMGNHHESQEKSGTGKIAINVKVTDLQPEKIAGWNTKHYMVEMHIQNSGCVGNGSSDMKMELWVADVKDAHGCKAHVDYGAIIGRREGGHCKVTYETTGDYARLGAIWNGLVMRRKIYDKDGKVTTIQEITSLSQAKLDDSVFTVPAGYTKLSIDDYNKQRQQAMMKAVMGGANGNAADDNQDNADQGNDKNDDQDKKEKKKKHHGFHLPGGLPF